MKRDVCIGRTRGGKNTKIHALVNREGIPVCLSISAGNCADCDQAIPLLQKFGKIKGSNILGDRAYGQRKFDFSLLSRVPSTPSRQPRICFILKYDRQTYKRRNVIERCFCRLKDSGVSLHAMIREPILFRPFFSLLLLLLFSPFCTYEPTSQIHPRLGWLVTEDLHCREGRSIMAYCDNATKGDQLMDPKD